MVDSPRNSSDGLKAHACVLCQRRKVKCDRQTPCAGCTKAQVECEYRDPLPSRRRKKKTPEAVMVARIRRYEDALQKAGISVPPIEEDDSLVANATETAATDDSERYSRLREPSSNVSDQTPENSSRHAPGRLITKKGRSLYLDNHLWKSVSHELQDAEDILSEADSEKPEKSQTQNSEDFNSNFIFQEGRSRQPLTRFHPNTIQIFKLWNTFLDGVNPLTKIIHVPTLQQRILDAASDLDSLSPELEALMFAIYSTALLCMRDEEFQKFFSGSRSALFAQYRQCTQQALANVGVLGTSDLMVLQAFLLYILSIRLVYSPHILWSMSGICIRIAQRIGLHKDGSKLGLSVFETEMRRRIWWNAIVIDSTIGHMAGCESNLPPMNDTKMPCNVNDSALDPDMKETPIDASGATEMIFCLMSYNLGTWLARQAKLKTSSFDGLWEFLSSTSIPLEQKDSAIDEIENTFQTKYISHCDLSLPLHLVAFVVAKSAVASTRLRAHHPRQYQEKGQPIPQSEKGFLFNLCLKMLEYSDLLFSSKKTQKFHWHIDFHFPWDSFIVILLELRHRNIGEDTAKAWRLIDTLFHRQYKVLSERKRSPLHLAVANLTIKAWSGHISECERLRINPLPQPQLIGVLWRYIHRDESSASILNHSITTTDRSTMSVEQTMASSSQIPNISLSSSQLTTTTNDRNNTILNFHNQPLESSPLNSEQPASHATTDDSNNDHDMTITTTTAETQQLYPVDDSPMDWEQWDALLHEFHEFQDYTTAGGDVDVLFVPS